METKTETNFGNKPKMLVCFICGREFSSASLEIHLRQCKQKNESNNKIIEIPEEFENTFTLLKHGEKLSQDEIDTLNQYAEKLYREKMLVACPNCGRRFNEDSLVIHLRGCKKVGKVVGNGTSRGSSTMESNSIFQEKLNKELMKSQEGSGSSGGVVGGRKPNMLMCYLCGGEFSKHSLEIHIKTCMQKMQNNDRQIPDIPDVLSEIFQKVSLNETIEQSLINEYNEIAEDSFKKVNYDQCVNCGRRFLPEQLEKHKVSCKGTSSSGTNKVNKSQSPIKSKNNRLSQSIQVTSDSTKLLEQKLEQQLGKGGGGSIGSSSMGGIANKTTTKGFGGRPLTLVCYICGREFGRTSLQFHIRSCGEKFVNEEANIGNKVKFPKIPEELEEILDKIANGNDITSEEITNINAISERIHRTKMMKECPGCHRKFNRDSFEVHLRSCKSGAEAHNANAKVPNMSSRPRMLLCPLCGREYGTTSLDIHIKTCKKKFLLEQEQLPPKLRKDPEKIIEAFQRNNNLQVSSNGKYNVDAFNDMAYDTFKNEALVSCDGCGRTFLPDRLLVHQRSCLKKKS